MEKVFSGVQYVDAKCKKCDADFKAGQWLSYRQDFCEKCSEYEIVQHDEQQRREALEAKAQRKLDRWRCICPPLYQTTDLSRLPGVVRPAIDKVLGWECGPRGMVLHGETGLGKTRVAMMALKGHHMAGLKVVPLLAGKFAYQVMTLLGESTSAFAAWYEGLIAADIVLLDDLGKEKMTERCETELFNLIEERSQHLRPLIVTTNTVGDSLEDKLSDDRSGPLLRRVREFCEPVSFVVGE